MLRRHLLLRRALMAFGQSKDDVPTIRAISRLLAHDSNLEAFHAEVVKRIGFFPNLDRDTFENILDFLIEYGPTILQIILLIAAL